MYLIIFREKILRCWEYTSIDSIINGNDFSIRNANNLVDPSYKLKNVGELLSVMFFLTEVLPFLKVSIDTQGDDMDSFEITAALKLSYSIKEFMSTIGIDDVQFENNAYDNEYTLKAVTIAILDMIKGIKWEQLDFAYEEIKERFIAEGSKFNLNNLCRNKKASEQFFVNKLLQQLDNLDADYTFGDKAMTYESFKKDMLKLYGWV